MAPVRRSLSDRARSIFGKLLLRRPLATGCGVPSGEPSEITTHIEVCLAVLDSRNSRLAGPAESTFRLSGAVVYESPCGSASVMSLSTGKALISALSPAAPAIAALGGSLLPGGDGSAG